MADISAITALDGVTYSIKDSEAREHLVPSAGTTGQVLTKTASGYGWADASGGGNVDTVNGISPDAQKNVQTDVVLTQAEYDALPSSKLTDNVNYFISDGAYHPQGSSIDAGGVIYDNTDSGLTATTVQAAIDENASSITDFINHLPYLQEITGTTTSAGLITLTVPFEKVVSVNVASVGNNWYALTRKAGTGNAACFIFDNGSTTVANTSVTLAVWRLP